MADTREAIISSIIDKIREQNDIINYDISNIEGFKNEILKIDLADTSILKTNVEYLLYWINELEKDRTIHNRLTELLK